MRVLRWKDLTGLDQGFRLPYIERLFAGGGAMEDRGRGNAENERYSNPASGTTPGGFVPETPYTGSCKTCGGWVAPNERVHTDEGLYHDRIDSCLTTEVFEALVAKWSCECGQEYRDHLEEEHREDQEARAHEEVASGQAGATRFETGTLTPWSTEELLHYRGGAYYSTEELAARERRFMDARLP